MGRKSSAWPSLSEQRLKSMFQKQTTSTNSRYSDEPVLKKDKGKKAGSCNRTACQRPGAVWWNRGSYAYYCADCAHMLNRVNNDFEGGDLCVIDPEALELLEKQEA